MDSADISHIPVDFIQAFEEAVQNSFDLAGANDTVAQRAALFNLREQVRENNAYIQPDGNLAYIQASREELTAAIAAESRRTTKDASQPTRLVRIAGLSTLAFLALGLGWFLWQSRPAAQRAAIGRTDSGALITPRNNMAAPTSLPPIPPVSQDALSAIGGNGQSLTLGEPSLLEIIYEDGVSAFPISPAGLTNVGALRFQEAVMLSDTPVAVWLANTRLNYGIGIPRSLIKRLTFGNKVTVFTNTGAELPFLIRDISTRRSYQTADILKQDRIGLSLFALPALSDELVDVAFAVYDVSHERLFNTRVELGTSQFLGPLTVALADAVVVNEQANQQIAVTLAGSIRGTLSPTRQIVFNLTTDLGQQTGSIQINTGQWKETFVLSAAPPAVICDSFNHGIYTIRLAGSILVVITIVLIGGSLLGQKWLKTNAAIDLTVALLVSGVIVLVSAPAITTTFLSAGGTTMPDIVALCAIS